MPQLETMKKQIKTLLLSAGFHRVNGTSCLSYLNKLQQGAVVAAETNGAYFFWADLNAHYEEHIKKRDEKPLTPICYLFMNPNGEVISLSNFEVCDIIKQWRIDDKERTL